MFPGDLDVRVVKGGQYRLLKPLVYVRRGNTTDIIVPTGFLTDFASVPQGFRWLITGHDDTRKPATLHDYLYAKKIMSRKEADQLFEHAMYEERVPLWRRKLCYAAVRVGGWAAWRKYER